MADENNELLTQFISITGADPETSKVYLQSSGWDLQSAMETYFDNAPTEGMEDDETDIPTGPADIPTGPAVPPSNPPTSRTQKPKIATLASFGPEEEDNDNDDRQAFYAGGSETSGQQIVGPPRKKKEKSEDLTQSIFDSAKRHGAEVVDRSQEENKKKKAPAFRGSGFRLGDTEGVSDVIESPSASNIEAPEPVDVELNFWINGFSIDDGPLRDMNDPENEEFLRTITNGEIPRELLHLHRGRQINVNMVKKETEYVKPKKTVKAFSGAGHTLGSPTPKLVSSRTATSSSTASSAPAPQIDDSAPVTTLQIRLADGTRLVAKFNHSSTIDDVRHFINASRPEMAGRDYVLMTTFPRKEFTDESLSLVDAKLLNAVVVQQFKQR